MNKRSVIITIVSVLILTCLFAFARTTTTDLGLVKPVWDEDLDILVDINANTDILEAFANDPLEFDTGERLEDRVGAMVSDNTETLITLTYQDADNTIDAVVDDDLHKYSWTNVVDADIPNAITITAYMEDEDINTFSELQSWVSDKTLVNVEDGITATAIQDDLILKADFADEDWGDMSVSTNVVTLDVEVVDSDQYIDASIDHEHLAPDVISGMTDVTSADADYILIWDATDSALKKCDMGEVRGAGGGDVTKVGTPVNNQIGVWTGDGTLEGDANLTYDGTTVVLGTGQINFPDSQNASGDANTLDDYEEGTWTPVIVGAGTAGTYEINIAYAQYTKIGRMVNITCNIIRNAEVTGGGAGNLVITGFPFTITGATFSSLAYMYGSVLTKDYSMVMGVLNTTTALILSLGVDGTQAVMQIGDFDASGYLSFSLTYYIQ